MEVCRYMADFAGQYILYSSYKNFIFFTYIRNLFKISGMFFQILQLIIFYMLNQDIAGSLNVKKRTDGLS